MGVVFRKRLPLICFSSLFDRKRIIGNMKRMRVKLSTKVSRKVFVKSSNEFNNSVGGVSDGNCCSLTGLMLLVTFLLIVCRSHLSPSIVCPINKNASRKVVY